MNVTPYRLMWHAYRERNRRVFENHELSMKSFKPQCMPRLKVLMIGQLSNSKFNRDTLIKGFLSPLMKQGMTSKLG